LPILPVIDLKHGQVVRAVAGQRDQYQPIKSPLATDAHPASIAQAFVDNYSCRSAYVADLDAISGSEPNWRSIRAIADCGLDLWLDIGIKTAQHVFQLREFFCEDVRLDAIIVALEAARDPDTVESLFRAVDDTKRAVFSLDLQNGQPMTCALPWSNATPTTIANNAIKMGFRRLIALDVSAVGVGHGPVLESTCREIRLGHNDIQLTSGGGVRNMDDVCRFLNAGCDFVLVSSALHDGRLDAASIALL